MCEFRRELADLVAEELHAVPDATLAEDIVALRADINRREAELIRRLAAFDARGAAGSDGSVSTAAWLRTRLGMSAESSDRVRTARALRRLPRTAAEFSAGSLSYRHAALIAATVDDLDDDRVAAADTMLAGWATELDVGRLRRLASRFLEIVEPDRALAEANASHARRLLHMSQTLDGGYRVDGSLDAEAGSILAAALVPLAVRSGPDDTRTPAQRRADALTELARRALHGGGLPATGGDPPHLTLVVDLPTLSRRAGDDQCCAGGPGVDGERQGGCAGFPPPELLERTGAWLDWSGPVTAETARRIACDAGVSRVITDGPSQVLDLGRRTRIVSAAQRRALAVRDRGCRFPGCDRPPQWTDAHHIVHWVDGGPTDLDNLVLLCRAHHRSCHEEGWTVSRGADGVATFLPPDRASPPGSLLAA